MSDLLLLCMYICIHTFSVCLWSQDYLGMHVEHYIANLLEIIVNFKSNLCIRTFKELHIDDVISMVTGKVQMCQNVKQ